MPRADYEADLKKAHTDGYRLVSSTAYRKNGEFLFAYITVEDPDNLEWEEKHDLTLSQLRGP